MVTLVVPVLTSLETGPGTLPYIVLRKLALDSNSIPAGAREQRIDVRLATARFAEVAHYMFELQSVNIALNEGSPVLGGKITE